MKYVSIDIETSGLDTENNQILSIGAIVEDTEKKLSFFDIPKFHCIVLQRSITGSPFALNMNAEIIKWMSIYIDAKDKEKPEVLKAARFAFDKSLEFYEEGEVAKAFFDFLWKNGIRYDIPMNKEIRVIDDILYPVLGGNTKPLLINVAGKNFGTFDNVFLKKLPWWQKLIIAKQRIMDPAMLFIDWEKDEELPSLSICKSRVGIDGKVSHNALEDAWDVIHVLRSKY